MSSPKPAVLEMLDSLMLHQLQKAGQKRRKAQRRLERSGSPCDFADRAAEFQQIQLDRLSDVRALVVHLLDVATGIERATQAQLTLIDERSPGPHLDKLPVVDFLTGTRAVCRAARARILGLPA